MADFRLVDHATLKPGYCLLCHGVSSPQIDTGVALPQGAVYVCATCADQMTRLLGGLTADEKKTADEAARVLHTTVHALRGELLREQASKVVPLADVERRLAGDAA